MAGNEVLQFPPHMFDWVKICSTGRCWPPIDALFLVEIFGNSAGVLWVIVLHKTVLSATEVFLYEGQQIPFQNLCV